MPEKAKLKIGIIGVGAAGLAALQVITDSTYFKEGHCDVVAFEAREDVGGVWFPDLPVPKDRVPATPLYDSLTTNLPHPIMSFRSLLFPPSTPLFPVAATVEKYLRSYAEHFNIRQYVRLNSRVQQATWNRSSSRWAIHVASQVSTSEEEFDKLIIANGHYHLPFIPEIPGLDSWVQSNKASHSVYYRHADYLGKVVLVVGGGPSGQDIADEMSAITPLVIHSVPGSEAQAESESGKVQRRGRVAGFSDEENGTAFFEDGTSQSNIDYCILATGYVISFAFFGEEVMQRGMPPNPTEAKGLPPHLFNSSMHVYPLAKEIFPIQEDYPSTSLAFMGLPVKVIPFPVFETQARFIIKAFFEPSILDVEVASNEVVKRYETLRRRFTKSLGQPELESNKDIEEKIAHAWHRVEGSEQFEYRDALHELAGYGPEWKVAPWERELHGQARLRPIWRDLEKKGESQKWVEGVGTGNDPLEEWIDLIRRLLKEFDTPLSMSEEIATKL